MENIIPAPPGNTRQRRHAGRFVPGQSGNPNGRPKGARNKMTLAIEALLDGEGEAITRKLIEKANEGDMAALRLCLERLLPLRRDRPVSFDLPAIKSSDDALKASSSILAACADGILSPSEATQVMELVSSHVRMIESTEIEARLSALEKQELKNQQS